MSAEFVVRQVDLSINWINYSQYCIRLDRYRSKLSFIIKTIFKKENQRSNKAMIDLQTTWIQSMTQLSDFHIQKSYLLKLCHFFCQSTNNDKLMNRCFMAFLGITLRYNITTTNHVAQFFCRSFSYFIFYLHARKFYRLQTWSDRRDIWSFFFIYF